MWSMPAWYGPALENRDGGVVITRRAQRRPVMARRLPTPEETVTQDRAEGAEPCPSRAEVPSVETLAVDAGQTGTRASLVHADVSGPVGDGPGVRHLQSP